MKKIIDGKLYDTATAQQLCELESTEYVNDFHWHETRLYRTKNGAFFVAGRGGPASMWASPRGQSSWADGSGLRVIDDFEARSHMETANCTAEDYSSAGLEIGEG